MPVEVPSRLLLPRLITSVRTQLCLSDEQRNRIDSPAERDGVSVAGIVRRALDAHLDSDGPDPGPVLAAAFGLAPDATTPDREEWDRG